MAADTSAFLDVLGLSNAHLVGFSDGAIVALSVALDRSDLVPLVLIGSRSITRVRQTSCGQ